MKTLNNWSYVDGNFHYIQIGDTIDTPYKIHGVLSNGDKVYTSFVIEANGKTVRTKSGSTYCLGRISESYARWQAENAENWHSRWSC